MPPANVPAILSRFGLANCETVLERVSHGYINDTYRVTVLGSPVYILQKINTSVFPQARQVMENLVLMLPFLQGPSYTALKLEHTLEGTPWLETESGEVWRLFRYIENSGTLESTDSPAVSREAGRILGCFHQLVCAAPVEKLLTPLPRFHDLSWRAQELEQAISRGVADRAEEAGTELDLSQDLIAFCRKIPILEFPIRICHNDTKLSNFLFDLATEKGLCLIDLDTLMPGHLLYDFGDAARTLVNPLPESYPTRERVQVDLNMFEAYVRGWQESGFKIEGKEARWLPYGVVLMPTLHGIRALADHLLGDKHYRTAYPGQNLVRAKNLLGFADKARGALAEMEGILSKIL